MVRLVSYFQPQVGLALGYGSNNLPTTCPPRLTLFPCNCQVQISHALPQLVLKHSDMLFDTQALVVPSLPTISVYLHTRETHISVMAQRRIYLFLSTRGPLLSRAATMYMLAVETSKNPSNPDSPNSYQSAQARCWPIRSQLKPRLSQPSSSLISMFQFYSCRWHSCHLQERWPMYSTKPAYMPHHSPV